MDDFIEKHEGITVEHLEAKAEERLAEGGYGDVMVDEAPKLELPQATQYHDRRLLLALSQRHRLRDQLCR